MGVKGSVFSKSDPTLFVRRTLALNDAGKLKVEADYSVKGQKLDVKTEWSSSKFGSVFAVGAACRC